MTRPLPAGRTRVVTPYRVGVSVLLAAAAAVLYVGVTRSADPSEEGSAARPPQVVSFFPDADTPVLRQSRIFAELKPEYVGVLQINGVEIPEDQLEHLEGSNWVGYTPGADTETGALNPGRNCATVVFWQLEAGRGTSDSFQWCWTAH
ncbi:MAG TPA: hypothetical protein VMZ22_00310 [Acidimicrobiales bacterium]|nr:hypothetical protein [Acidimicrobiales bacterium]